MNESILLIAASLSMLGVSLLAAALLYWLNAGTIAVVLGATLAGIAVFASFWLLRNRLVTGESFMEEEGNA